MENVNEKLENIEEIMELFIGKMKLQDDKLSVIIENHSSQSKNLTAITASDNKVTLSIEEITNLQASIIGLVKKIEQLPDAFKIKHQHHYEIKSRFYFIGALIVFLVVAISMGSSIFLILRNSELKIESDKFKVIRGAYPDLASEIDGLYQKDKDDLIKNADLQIHENQLLMEAIYREAQSKKDYEKAKQSKKSLKQKNKKTN